MPIWEPPEGAEPTKDTEDKGETEKKASESNSKELGPKAKRGSSLRRKSSGMRGEGELEDASVHKLEQDYIQMYLGELTPMQESKLVQLKSRVAELLKGKVPSDQVFLRFLRARDFNVEKAREMLSQSMIWRKKHGVDKIQGDYRMPAVMREFFPGGWHFSDREDRPLFILRLGQMDVKVRNQS